MKPLTKKVLESGLVDKHLAQMLEKWGNLPPGATEIIKDDKLKNATRDQLVSLGEEIGDEVEKLRTLKETQLDLENLRWPTEVSIKSMDGVLIGYKIPAVVDRMDRLYFRIQDVDPAWFIPGCELSRDVVSPNRAHMARVMAWNEEIIESTILYSDDVPVCVQVTVRSTEKGSHGQMREL